MLNQKDLGQFVSEIPCVGFNWVLVGKRHFEKHHMLTLTENQIAESLLVLLGNQGRV